MRRPSSAFARPRAASNMTVTVAGSVSAQVPLLISGVLVARALGVEDRGHLALIWVIALALAIVGATGMPSSVTFWVARDPGVSRSLARRILPFAGAQAVLATAVQALVLFLALGGQGSQVRLSALVSLVVPTAMVSVMYAMAFLQGLQQFRQWTALRLLPPVLYSALVVVLVALGVADLLAVTTAWAFSFVVTALAAVRWATAYLPERAEPSDPPSLGALQRFGAKAFLGAASPSDTLQLDQALVGLFVSPTALGLYVVGLAFTNLPRLVAQSLGYVAYPAVAQEADAQRARRSMWRWTALAAGATILLVVPLELSVGVLVPLMFGPAFDGAITLTRVLLLSAVLVGVRRVLSDGARGAGYPSLGAAAEVASMIVLLVTLAILSRTDHGVLSIAYALGVSSAVSLAGLLAALWLSPIRAQRRVSSANVVVD